MLTPLEKWLLYYSPLSRGRLDFLPDGDMAARFDTFGQFIWLGRFWMRRLGGHNLRRSTGRDAPALSAPLVGRSDGPASSISTWPWAGNAANSKSTYQLKSVGGGGVESEDAAVLREVGINGSQTAVALPNAPTGLQVTPLSSGAFTLEWTYNDAGEQAAPGSFAVYSDSGDGSVDYSSALGTVTYVSGQVLYTFTTGVLAGSSEAPFIFGVRSRTSAGDEEANLNTVSAVGSNSAQYGTVGTRTNVLPLARPNRISDNI